MDVGHQRGRAGLGRDGRPPCGFFRDGTKELYAKKSGARLRILAKPNPKYATKA